MFKTSKKIEDPPMLSLQEIQQDMETFAQCDNSFYSNDNKHHIIEELKSKNSSVEISDKFQWWKIFQIFQSQITDMEKTFENVGIHKKYFSEKREEIDSQKISLEEEIGNNLEAVRKLKSPE